MGELVAKRVDANQPAIVRDLRKLGCEVRHTHTIGHGFPDIIVAHKGQNYLFEIKDPTQTPSRRRLTPDEKIFFDSWIGQVDVIETTEDALKVMGMRK